jgi:hypothetical protein
MDFTGMMKRTIRKIRYKLGSDSYFGINSELPCVKAQKRKREKNRGIVAIVARRYVER